jgi:hypothetical protein
MRKTAQPQSTLLPFLELTPWLRRCRLAAGMLAVIALIGPQLSVPPAAGSEAMLVLTNATAPNQPEVALAEADLRALPQVTIRTRTEFTDGVVEFVGPRARDVLAMIAAGTATTAHMVAANDYAVDIPVSDFAAYDVILAMQANGEPLSLRDKGPLWVMYPIDDHKELLDPLYNIRLIWQLTRVELR